MTTKAAKAPRAAEQKAATQRCPPDSSKPQDASGQTAAISAPADQPTPLARTTANAPKRCPHRSQTLKPRAAKACNPHIEPKAAKAAKPPPHSAPNSSQKNPANTHPATL